MKKLYSIFFFILAVSLVNAKENQNVVTIALSSAPSQLNPFFSTDANSQNINRLINISLVDFDGRMKLGCILCDSYRERIVDGRHHIRFQIKKNISFWDGVPVKAKDVKNSHYYFTEGKVNKSIFRFAFRKIEQVVVYNDYDLEIVYKKFHPENMSNLVLLKIIRVVDSKLDHEGRLMDRPDLSDIIGAGEYKLEKIRPAHVRLIPSRNKKRPDLLFKIVKDETTLALKLIKREVDLSLANISHRKYQWMKKNNEGGLNFWEIPSSNYKYININHRRKKLQDLRVRRALSLLIPRRDILKYKLKGSGILANGMFSPAFADMFINDEFDQYNPGLAKELLKEAGLRKNKEGYYAKNGREFSLDWKVSSNKSALEMVETIKFYFNNAGIKVNVTIQEWGTFMRSFKNGGYDLIMGQWIGFAGPEILEAVFHSQKIPPKGLNRGHFKDSKVDNLLDEASTTLIAKKRNDLYKKVQRLANQKYAYINLWHPNIVWIGRSCLEGIKIYPNGSFSPLLNIVTKCPGKEL